MAKKIFIAAFTIDSDEFFQPGAVEATADDIVNHMANALSEEGYHDITVWDSPEDFAADVAEWSRWSIKP